MTSSRATHDHAIAHLAGQGRVPQEGQRHVRQRPERDQGDLTRIAVDGLLDHIRRVLKGRGPAVNVQADVPHAIAAMDVLRALVRTQERGAHALIDGDIRPGKFDRVKGVLHPLLERNIASDDGDRLDPNLRVRQRHDQRHRVIRSGVGIDQKVPHLPKLSP